MCGKTKTLTGVFLLAAGILGTVFAALFMPSTATAAAGVNQQLNFTGKVVNTNDTNIADGTYNMEFKIYQDGTNTGSGSTLKWTEDELISASHGVVVSGGTFQVNLGAVTSLSSVDFNQDTLWLSMQVGSGTTCTITTGFTANCGGDGEMSPYIRLTAVPYAFNALKVGGLSASQLVQLTPGSQQSGSINVSGNIATGGTIQGNTVDAATSGALTLGGTNATSISVVDSTTITSGHTLTVQGGNAVTLGSTTAAGGIIYQDGTVNNRTVTVSSPALTNSYSLAYPVAGATGSQCLQSTSGSTSTVTALQFGSCSGSPSGSAGGDLGGTYPNPTVAKINGVGLGSTTATSGNLLIGSGSQWVSQSASGAITINNSGVTTLGSGVVSNSNLAAGTFSNITGTGALSAGSIASGFGTIVTGNTITGTTVNGTTGINTGAGAGTQRISSAGNLLNIGSITSSGALSVTASSSTGTIVSIGGVITETNSLATGHALTLNGDGGGQIVLENSNSGPYIDVTGSTGFTSTSAGLSAFGAYNNFANSTVPVAVFTLGATPGTGGDALQFQNSSFTAIGGINSSGYLYYKNSTYTTTLNTTTLSANQTITLPNATGTICLGSGNCSTAGGYIVNGTTTQTGNLNIQSAASGSVAAIIQGAASQSADLLDIKNSSGTVISSFDNNGNLNSRTISAYNGLNSYASSTAYSALYAQATASATAPVATFRGGATPGAGGDLLQLQNSSATVLSAFNSSGYLALGNGTATSVLTVTHTETNAVGAAQTYSNYTITPSSAPSSVATWSGFSSVATATGSNLNANTYINSYSANAIGTPGTGITQGGATGGSFTATANGAGTLSGATGGTFNVQNIGAGGITYGNGIQIASPTVSGGGYIFVQNGIYIAAQKVSGVSTGYGISQAGSNDLNQFNGISTFTNASTTAFQIQNSGSNAIFNADGTNSIIQVGSSSTAGLTTGTFGTAKDLLAYDNGDQNFFIATQYTTGTLAQTVTSMQAYIGTVDASTSNRHMQVAIYTDNGSNAPSTLVATSASTSIAIGLNTFAVTASLSANTKYWLAFNTDSNSNGIGIIGSGGITMYNTTATTYGTMPSTAPATSGPAPTLYSLWANVSTGGAVSTFNSTALSTVGNLNVRSAANSATAFSVSDAANNSLLNVDSSKDVIRLTAAQTIIQPASTTSQFGDNTSAFAVQNTSSVSLLNADTLNMVVTVNNPNSGITTITTGTDSFNSGGPSLPAQWTLYRGSSDTTSSTSYNSALTGDLRIIPKTTAALDCYTGSTMNCVRVLEASPTGDFTIDTKLDTNNGGSGSANDGTGIFVTTDATCTSNCTYIRFEKQQNSSTTFVLVAYGATAGTADNGGAFSWVSSGNISNTAPVYLHVARAGNVWTYSYSTNGTSYTTVGSFTKAMTMTGANAKIGPYFDNGVADASYTSSDFDYFNVAQTTGTYATGLNVNGDVSLTNGRLIIGGNTICDSTGCVGGTGTTGANQTLSNLGTTAINTNLTFVGASTIQATSSQLTLNGSNIQIGSATTDTTAVLLGLDSYSTSADPTGFNGAMYYNTAQGTFRCYESNAWENCVSGLLNHDGWSVRAGGGTTSTTAFNSVGVLMTISGSTYAASNGPDAAYETVTTGTTAGASGGFVSTTRNTVRRQYNPTCTALIRTPGTLTSGERIYVSLNSASIANANDPGGSMIGMRFSNVSGDTGTGTGWRSVTRDGTTVAFGASNIGGSANVATGTIYLLKIRVDDTSGTVYMSVNGSAETAVTSNLPASSTDLGATLSITTTDTVSDSLLINRMACEQS